MIKIEEILQSKLKPKEKITLLAKENEVPPRSKLRGGTSFAIDWINGGAQLQAGGIDLKVHVSPYSFGGDVQEQLFVTP